MSLNTAFAAASMLPPNSVDSLLSSVLMCGVMLGAALLYSASRNRRP